MPPWKDSTLLSSPTGKPLLGKLLLLSVASLTFLFPAKVFELIDLIWNQSGNSENPGIIPQAVSEIFSFIRDVSHFMGFHLLVVKVQNAHLRHPI